MIGRSRGLQVENHPVRVTHPVGPLVDCAGGFAHRPVGSERTDAELKRDAVVREDAIDAAHPASPVLAEDAVGEVVLFATTEQIADTFSQILVPRHGTQPSPLFRGWVMRYEFSGLIGHGDLSWGVVGTRQPK